MSAHEELIGADFFEHDIRHPGKLSLKKLDSYSKNFNYIYTIKRSILSGVGVSRAVSVLKNFHKDIDETLEPKGFNKGMNKMLLMF